MQRSTTGIHVSFYDTQRPLYYARGFLITDLQVDGLPAYSANTNQEFDTALYERIEIVRGANGILTGVGTPSATINLIRKQPDAVSLRKAMKEVPAARAPLALSDARAG